MKPSDAHTVRDALLLVRDRPPFEANVRPYARRSDLVRLQVGVYAPAREWAEWDPDARHLARVHAALLVRETPLVVAYESAATAWGYPRIGAPPVVVHLVASTDSGAHSAAGVRIHRDHLPESDLRTLGALTLTSPARTLLDVARTAPALQSLAAADAALRRGPRRHGGVTTADLHSQFETLLTKRGRARARWVLGFADGGASNPGESWSRLRIAELGFVPPRLQTEHPNPLGGRYFTDFEWAEQRVIGEFDGKGKYLKEEYLGDLTPGEAVYREKRREDHLRDDGSRVVRWGWPELEHPKRLDALLRAAGVPLLRPLQRPGHRRGQ